MCVWFFYFYFFRWRATGWIPMVQMWSFIWLIIFLFSPIYKMHALHAKKVSFMSVIMPVPIFCPAKYVNQSNDLSLYIVYPSYMVLMDIISIKTCKFVFIPCEFCETLFFKEKNALIWVTWEYVKCLWFLLTLFVNWFCSCFSFLWLYRLPTAFRYLICKRIKDEQSKSRVRDMHL